MDSSKLNGRTPVAWSNDPAAKASAMIDALARYGAGLVCVNDAVYVPDADGQLHPLGRDALKQTCRDHLVALRGQNLRTVADPRYKITYELIDELDEQTVRNVLSPARICAIANRSRAERAPVACLSSRSESDRACAATFNTRRGAEVSSLGGIKKYLTPFVFCYSAPRAKWRLFVTLLQVGGAHNYPIS